ncbi:MAG: DUF1330 domain-containing protein [Pseudomonadota bacterium]
MSAYLNPEREQFEAFKALPRDEPINMLNLLRFKPEVTYPDGETVSGKEAYRRYGEASGPIFAAVGGEIVWRGNMEAMVIGPDDKRWDLAFIARYPAASDFLAMIANPEYQAITHHRTLALEDSRLIRFGELPLGAGFGS